ncbi:MAG: hypothetical protein O3A29_14960 [Planctomycetota bacterium]|nr:hypothetical protein [Planctomycetota bacterium]
MTLPHFSAVAQWFSLDLRTQIELTGSDRAKFLHNFCTQEIKNLTAGSAGEAFITNVKGRILGHVWVFANETSLWIDTVPDQASALITHLDKYLITEEVAFHDRTAEWNETIVSGPETATKLGEIEIDVTSLAAMQHSAGEWRGTTVVVRRVDWFGGPGFLLDIPVAHAESLRTALSDAGIAQGTQTDFEVYRIRFGLPHYGVDLTEENLAQEAARTTTAINFRKGCYLGQEPIARIDALGHVNRELRSLEIETAEAPPRGTPIFAESDGKAIGEITSSATSAADGISYAMSMLPSRFTSPGTTVRIATPDGPKANVFWEPPV